MREIDRAIKDVKVYTGVNVECFLYMNADNQPCVAGYSGKKNKPNFRYRYRSTSEAIIMINNFILDHKQRAESKRLGKIEDKKLQKEIFDTVEVGSIFVSSWGYDQTNVNAYQVIEKKGSSTVVLREICIERTAKKGSCSMSDNVIPVKDSFRKKSDPFEKRVNRFGISMSSYSSASLWDGKEDYYRSWYA